MKIGFIGAGKMAAALVRGVVAGGAINASDVTVTDVHPGSSETLRDALGLNVATSNTACIACSDVVFLCVKPNDAATALAGVGDALGGKLVVSIMAGTSIDRLTVLCGSGVRVIRAMPNTAAVVGASATVYCVGVGVSSEDRATVQNIFGAVGTVAEVPEKLMDAVTGLSGSGPAYVFLMIESLADGGVRAGLPRALAQQLAIQTVLGAGKLAAATGEHPALLREAVTSPGGTTAAGLAVLESFAIRSALAEAVAAAADRAAEMGS